MRAGPPPTPPRIPVPVGGGDEVEESVALWIGNLWCYRRRRVELPAEQLAKVAAEPIRVLADDLQMCGWMFLGMSLLADVRR